VAERGRDGEGLSWTTRIAFGSGDLLGGGAMTLVGIYYLHFLTDVVRLSPALAGVAILLSKGWDAVSDPLMGMISDRTRSRMGRRRPYFLAGVPLVFFAMVALWYPADLSTETGRFAFALCSYLFFSSVLTMVLIPYYALGPELALEYNERSKLMAVRLVFATAGSMATSIVPLLIVHGVESVHTGYITIGLVFGAAFSLPFLAVFLLTRERTEFRQPPRSFSFRETFVEPVRIRSFRSVLVMYLFTLVATDLILAIAMYFMTYYLGLQEGTSLAVGSILVVQVVAIPGYFFLSKKTDKRTTFIVSAVIWVTALLSSLALRPGVGTAWVMAFGGFVGLGTSGMLTMVWSLFADVPDVDELESGLRREGVFSGIFTFARKASSAIGLFLVSVVLELAGFQSPSQDMVDGVRTIVVQEQSRTFVTALRLAFAFLPLVFVGVAIVAAIRFPLTAELHARLNRLLTRRRRGEPPGEDDEREAAELGRILVGR
jgi:oligogalacturonide transporter